MCDLADAHAKGYLVRVPHFNSIFNYLEMPELTPILCTLIERSSLPLKAIETRFAVDSSGFSTCRFVRWYDAKYGQEMEKHEWIKAHIMCGVTTNIVTSVEITGGYANDSPQFKPLLEATARHFPVYEVTADKAYSSRENLEAVERAHGTPYIPFKSNAVGRPLSLYCSKRTDLWDKLYHFYHLHRETFLEHYHQRSLVESTFMMMKAKFGDALRSKTDEALTNELLCKVLCHNICVLIQSMYELGIEPEF
jgi:Transposase DDE domain